uniref:Protein kinase domain-containing protein n=1 Tax=Labrus bergylta TaxID=56723 RepID=A0A3Q3GKD2_9LABR
MPSTPTSKPRPGAVSPMATPLATPAFGKDGLPPPPPSPGQKSGSGFWSSMPGSPASRPGSFTFPGEAGETPVRQNSNQIQTGSGSGMAVKHVNKKLMRRDRVTQELNLLQRLQHPHIVSLIDTYETPASYALVMEMADQGRLLDYIVSWGNLTEEKVACYLRDILEALHYLHNSRIVHLDVKPENMLVTGTSGQPTVKLTDFGDAVQLNSAHYVHPLLGSPEFASPELVLGEPVSLNSDMWSLGVVTYVLLSGASPFLDESAEETCLNICQLDFSFPRDYFQGVSQAARDFICLLLRTDPGRRPPAGLCLQEPWLQVGTAEGRARAEGCLDTSRLISFIDRRKHQTDTFEKNAHRLKVAVPLWTL